MTGATPVNARTRQFLQGLAGHPTIGGLASDVERAYRAIAAALEAGGTLYLCGNGGSLSDALHISGELLKSFALPRPLSPALRERLAATPEGAELAAHLQAGLRAHVLGVNPALGSAVANDVPLAGIGPAQELVALARPGDVLLAISTSGRSRNLIYAATLARALGMGVISLTGAADSPLSALADIALRAPASETYLVQELHLLLYHRLCLLLEAHFFGD
ncbi:MAG: D-sedoheptulose-7-phosphate isomerase [Anaerolineae bacterium]